MLRGSSMVRKSPAAIVRNLSVCVVEFLKLLGRCRLHPVNAECPICQQMVRLHYRKAGRRHVLAHARAYSRALYEGSHYAVHYTAKLKCLGSGAPNELSQQEIERRRSLVRALFNDFWSGTHGLIRLKTI